MDYINYGQTLTAYMLSAIDHYDENTDPSIILENADRVVNYIRAGFITPEQFAQINQAIMDKTGYDIDPDHDTSGYSIETLAEEVRVQGDGLAELGELVGSLLDGGE